MADVLRGLMAGMEMGRQRNAARKAAAREHQLALMDKSSALLKQAETAWQEMEDATLSDNWDPAMSGSLLDRAARFDATYGAIWKGRPALDHFSRALNLTRPKGSDPKIGPPGPRQPEIGTANVQGPPAPPSGVAPAEATAAGPMAGFRTQAQADKAAKSRRDARTQAAMPKVQQKALAFLEEVAFDERLGGIDLAKVPGALMRFKADFAAENDVDPKVLDEIIDEMEATFASQAAEQADAAGSRLELQKEFRLASDALSGWIDEEFAAGIAGIEGSVAMIEGTEAIRNQMEAAGQRMIKAGYDLPTIKIRLAEMFQNGSLEWPKGAAVPPYFAALSKAPPEFGATTQELFDQGIVDPIAVKPIYLEETGDVGLIDRQTGQWVAPEAFSDIRAKIRPPAAQVEQAAVQTGATRPGRPTVTNGPTAHKSIWDNYSEPIMAAAEKYNLDPRLIVSIIGKESAGRPGAVSSKGARGLMQLLPETAAAIGKGLNPNDPTDSIELGAKYLRMMLDGKEGSIADGNLELALASYNAGPGAVAAAGGVPDFKETSDYVVKIMQDYRGVAGADSQGTWADFIAAEGTFTPLRGNYDGARGQRDLSAADVEGMSDEELDRALDDLKRYDQEGVTGIPETLANLMIQAGESLTGSDVAKRRREIQDEKNRRKRANRRSLSDVWRDMTGGL